jgi:V8-like Glu-specific endopeptidase
MGKALNHSELIKKSRESCVRILIDSKKPAGSGFFVDANHVVTCFHVITSTFSIDPNTAKITTAFSIDPNTAKVTWRAYPDIVVVTMGGEKIKAECISVPKVSDISPFIFDFAVLRLKTKPKKSVSPISFSEKNTHLAVGNDVYFSGFPLGAPTMLTHKGMLSGLTKNKGILCIQASVNKGNSGGALLNRHGEAIGIISMREGGISKGLNQLRKHIEEIEKQKRGSLTMWGVNPLQSDKEIINVLNRYISTGIGYARNTSYVRDYIKKYALMKSKG